MGISFTFFAAKPKALKPRPEAPTGSKRHLDESNAHDDEDEHRSKRQRISEKIEEDKAEDTRERPISPDAYESDPIDTSNPDNTSEPAGPEWDAVDVSEEAYPHPRDELQNEPDNDQGNEPLPPLLPPRPHRNVNQVYMLFTTIVTALFAISPEALDNWTARVGHSLLRAADRLNVVRVWISAIIGNLWRVLCACAGS